MKEKRTHFRDVRQLQICTMHLNTKGGGLKK